MRTVIGREHNRVKKEIKRQKGKDGVSSATLAGRLSLAFCQLDGGMVALWA